MYLFMLYVHNFWLSVCSSSIPKLTTKIYILHDLLYPWEKSKPTTIQTYCSNLKKWLIKKKKKKGRNDFRTCIASNVVAKEPNGLSRAWTTAFSNESLLNSTKAAPNRWTEMHQTPKLQTACKPNKTKRIPYFEFPYNLWKTCDCRQTESTNLHPSGHY